MKIGLPVFFPFLLVCAGSLHAQSCSDLSLINLANDPLLRKLYQKPGWGRLEAKKLDRSGAYGANIEFSRGRSGKWFIEEQRYGVDSVEAGIDVGDPQAVFDAFEVFKWGFSKQGIDGGFAGTSDPFHSTSFFIEAAARSLLLLKQTGDSRYQGLVAAYAPKVHKAALWMVDPGVARRGRERNMPFVHRRWALAAALGLTAELTGDRRLARDAAQYAEEGLSSQNPEGYNSEKGGYDVNYNAVGLVFAEHYYTTLHCVRDAALKERIRRMLVASLNWEREKVMKSGDIDTTGSTRVGHETNRMGKVKTTSYGFIARAFALGAQVTGIAEFHAAAERITAYRWGIR